MSNENNNQQQVSADVINAANNPFANVQRLGSHGNFDFNPSDVFDEDEMAPLRDQQHQQYGGEGVPQIAPERAAAVAAAMNLPSESEREHALRQLYGEDFGNYNNYAADASSTHSSNNNNNNYPSQHHEPHPYSSSSSSPTTHQQYQQQRRGESGSPSNSSENNNNNNNYSSSRRKQQQEGGLSNLPGGTASLDELISRAAALDRECYDLQNEVSRWEKSLVECHHDIERVTNALSRYSTELAMVEDNVNALNHWFQEHTCMNDPERYERLGELNREVCGLKMRIKGLEQQLETLLQGTMMTTNYYNNEITRSSSPSVAASDNNDEARRVADLIQSMNSPSSSSASSPSTSSSNMVPIASPVKLPQSANSNSVKQYLTELEHKTLEQDVLILRLQEAASKRERLLQQERNNEMEIAALRSKLESAGITLPQAPIQHRTSRAIRKNQTQTAAALALSAGSDVVRRTIRLPSGILRDLTKELQCSVRQISHRCGVSEIAVEIASDATLLHCRGILRAVNSFEDEIIAAADRCKRHRALGGMVTYGAPQIAAVVADSSDKIAALLQNSNSHPYTLLKTTRKEII